MIADSRCAFAARGLTSDMTINDSPLVFVNVDLNICNGYDNTTGKLNNLGLVVKKTRLLEMWRQTWEKKTSSGSAKLASETEKKSYFW